jgi:hypothetical protein
LRLAGPQQQDQADQRAKCGDRTGADERLADADLADQRGGDRDRQAR